MKDAFGVSKGWNESKDKVAAGALVGGSAVAAGSGGLAVYGHRKETSSAVQGRAAAKTGQPYHGYMDKAKKFRKVKFAGGRGAVAGGLTALAGGGLMASNYAQRQRQDVEKIWRPRLWPKSVRWQRKVKAQQAYNQGVAARNAITRTTPAPPKPWYKKGSNQALMGLGVAGVGGGAIYGASQAKKQQQGPVQV